MFIRHLPIRYTSHKTGFLNIQRCNMRHFFYIVLFILYMSSPISAFSYHQITSTRYITALHAKKTVTPKALYPVYKPKSVNQELYVKYLSDPVVSIVLGVGSAGSGKTLFACSQAVEQLKNGRVQKIILTRPVVSVEEEIGFLPGSLINKMDPFTRPLFDILLEYYSQKDIDSMLHGGILEISPLAFMRGRTFKRAFIIADEMQNSSPNQMLMMTTRIGDGSKMVITGDLAQSDRGNDNGLANFIHRLNLFQNENTVNDIKLIEMSSLDIQRSPIVSKILDIFNDKQLVVPKKKIIQNRLNENFASVNITEVKFNNYNNDASLLPKDQLSPDKFIWTPKKI